MGLNFFIISIIVLSITFISYENSEEQKIRKVQNIPQVVFYDSILYEIDENHVQQIVQSKQLLNYKNKDEMYGATILDRAKNNLSDSISAEFMEKRADVYDFYQNVVVNRTNGVQFFSEHLRYNDANKILQNKTNFTFVKNDSSLDGENLYYNMLNEEFKADNTHFIIKGLTQ